MAISIDLTASPTNPQRSAPDTLREDADAYVNWHTGTFVPEMNQIIEDVNATIQGLFVGTSSTSITMAIGSKSFTMVEENLAFGIGNNLRIADTSNPTANYMEGIVTSYTKSTGVLVVTVSAVVGSGTIATWTMTLAPPIDFNRVRVWGDLTGAVAVPYMVEHEGRYYTLLSDLADVTAKEPGVDAEWMLIFSYSPDVDIQIDSFVLLTSGTSWTCPAGVRKVRMIATGAGGGAITSTDVYYGSSGGGGGTVIAVFDVTPSTAYTYAIGAGVVNGNGGNTTFTANSITYTANGGYAAYSYSQSGFPAGEGGTGSGTGAVIIRGDAGTAHYATNLPQYGGNTHTGYGVGASSTKSETGTAGANGGIILELYK